MLRRRLLSFVGAVGLVAGLLSSGVAAQADTSMSDSTFNSMVSTYTYFAQTYGGGQTLCFAYPSNTATCPTISQSSTSQNNVAVCVENNTTADELCTIDQHNMTGHNIAIVIQIYTKPQTANQTASITQTSGGGSNLAAIVHIVKQGTQSAGTQMDDQEASISQTGDPSTFDTGRNLSILHQSSTQFGQSGTLDAQAQNSRELGNVSQSRGGVSRTLADQSQSQTLKGLGVQTQHIDPRCCAVQQSNLNDDFEIVQHASQFEENPTPASQDSSTIGECSSSGHCGIDQTASINGGTPVHLHKDCTGTSCTSGIACSTASGCTPCSVVFTEGGPPLCPGFGDTIVAAYSNSAPAIARVGASLASRVRAAQLAPSGALLT